MAAHRILGLNLPSQVVAFRLLTGWHQEDLLDGLGGTTLQGGLLFDRLEDAVSPEGVCGGGKVKRLAPRILPYAAYSKLRPASSC